MNIHVLLNLVDGFSQMYKMRSLPRMLSLCRYQFQNFRGFDMSAHDLLNLLNESGKRDKMRGLPSILFLFRNEFDKFNKTRFCL